MQVIINKENNENDLLQFMHYIVFFFKYNNITNIANSI